MFSRLTNHWIYQVTKLKGDFGIGEILSLLGSVAGTGISLEAEAQEQNKMNKTLSGEQSWQDAFQKKGQGILNQQIATSTEPEAQKEIGQGASAATQNYANLQEQPTIATSGASTAPSASIATVGSDADARANVLNRAAAPVQGLQDWQVNQWIDALKAKTALTQNNQFSQMAEGVLPANLAAAQQSSEGLAAIGSILSSVGGLTGVLSGTTKQPAPNMTAGAFGGNWDTGNFGNSSNVVNNTN